MSYVEWAQNEARLFDFGKNDARRATHRFVEQMKEGLTREDATMSQIPSYVTTLPDGTDKGLYLAVDLGGTNLRVCAVDLKGDTTYSIKQTKVAIPSKLMVARSFDELLGFIANQLEHFLVTHHAEHLKAQNVTGPSIVTPSEKNRLLLGFTFSFAFEQQALDRGSLLRWTKGFDIPDAIGKDICSVFQAEIDKLGLPVTGKSTTLLGAIFGTGTNGAYVEKMSNLTKLTSIQKPKGDLMIVNTEWGAFDNEMDVLPDTQYDKCVDQESVHPGIQMFEKRISGMYLGEILRHAILRLASRHSTSVVSDKLVEQYAIDASFLSMAAGDKSTGLVVLKQQLKKHLDIDADEDLSKAVKILALAIGHRAARLAGVAIAGVIIKSGRLDAKSCSSSKDSTFSQLYKSVDLENGVSEVKCSRPSSKFWGSLRSVFSLTRSWLFSWPKWLFGGRNGISSVSKAELECIDVGVDGSLYEHYPLFEETIRSVLRDIEAIGPEGERRVQIGIAKDGSGVGAALAARAAGKSRELTD